ncbi:MAG: methylenetetrahydrofolate reductase [Pseudorhodoplanes sp.]|nr:methylenetetrahydrofolate reductase [Pseudorhodoplanes sp.]GIK80159.1 MAG: methylenetetrahydrofolate reductase [Alphaproteobacteria bacterium]
MIVTAPALDPAAALPAENAVRARIADFLSGYSLEATRPKAADIAALKNAAAPGTAVYLSAIPTRAPEEVLDQAVAVRTAGFEPVPHLAARNFASATQLSALLEKFAAQAGVVRVLVIAGDRDRAAGPYAGALELIESGLLARHGIRTVGIAGHPEGHPLLAPETLDRMLAAKIDAAEQSGLSVEIVTQFCFNAAAIVRWIDRVRDLGIEHRVRVGMAGPTSLTTLLRYAARCGVKASAAGAARQAGLMKNLFTVSAPDPIVRALAQTREERRLGDVSGHFFSFGGVDATARWVAAAAAGRIALDRAGGFTVNQA